MSDPLIALSGDDTVVISGASVSELRIISKNLRNQNDWLEVVDGIEDVSIQFDPLRWQPDEAIEKLLDVVRHNATRAEEVSSRLVELKVRFGGKDGPDMAQVCKTTGLTEREVVSLLQEGDLSVDMMGFVPGFAYIGGVPPALNIPRLETPRKAVPAGSLGLASGKCGTYALEAPGGWSLIGRITTPLFMPDADQPFLLEAGCRVKLVREATQ